MDRRPPRILCLAPNWIGDAVLALPALQLLADSGAELEIVARPGVERIVRDVPAVGAVHVLRHRSLWQRLRTLWSHRPRQFDAALALPPSFSAALLTVASGARHRVGEASDGRSALLTRAIVPARRDVHLALSYQRLALETLRVLSWAEPRRRAITQTGMPEGLHATPRLIARADELQRAQSLLNNLGLEASQKPILVAPGARYGPAKRYPPERFAVAADSLSRRYGQPVLLVGAAEDRASTALVQRALPSAIDVAGTTDLGDLLGLLCRATAVLSNDSGTMHLAAALDVAVVGVFGSSNPLWTRPLGRRATYIQQPVFCAPCYAAHCKQDFACMLEQPPEALVSAATRLLEPGSTEAGTAAPGPQV